MITLSYGMLRKMGACQPGLDYWKENFGRKKVELTPDLIRKYSQAYGMQWLAFHLTPSEAVSNLSKRVSAAERSYVRKSNAARAVYWTSKRLVSDDEKRAKKRQKADMKYRTAVAEAFAKALEESP